MQLPDEAIAYQYQGLLVPAAEEWTPAAELRRQHFLPPAKLKELIAAAACRCAARWPPSASCRTRRRRCSRSTPASSTCRRRLLDELPPQAATPASWAASCSLASQLREQVDRVVVLGIGGSLPGRPRALRGACAAAYHNELPAKDRAGRAAHLLRRQQRRQRRPPGPARAAARTPASIRTSARSAGASIVISKSGGTLETAAAYRAIRREAAEFYGPQLAAAEASSIVPDHRRRHGKLRDLCRGRRLSPTTTS